MGWEQLEVAAAQLRHLEASLNSVLFGNPTAVSAIVATVAAGGHVLIEDEPGVGKTLVARGLARAIGGSFGRVQGSPDLMPADVTGITVPDARTGEWTYRPGPIMNNVVLFDELNRATPRAQSALFEAMAERQVTSDGVTRALPEPFMVVATQNPSQHAGTFALPEGQLDRFWVAVSLQPPTRDIERHLLTQPPGYQNADALRPGMETQSWGELQRRVEQVPMAPDVGDYALDIVDQLRTASGRPTTPSPRAAQILAAVSRAHACLAGRNAVSPDDVKAMAAPVLSHRIGLSPPNLAAGAATVAQAVARVEVPVPG
jgi:MoxR-like ATPase